MAYNGERERERERAGERDCYNLWKKNGERERVFGLPLIQFFYTPL